MGSNQKDVKGGGGFFVCKLYECFFMPRMDRISGTNTLNHSKFQLLNGGMDTLIGYKMCNYKRCRQQ
jgi:hypothetical protein